MERSLDNGYNTGVIFMDLSKAIGLINHSLLLVKLDAHGFEIFFKMFFKI